MTTKSIYFLNRRRRHFAGVCGIVVCIVAIAAAVAMAEPSMDAFFSPRGGFAAVNRDRVITLADGRQTSASLESPVLNMIQRAEAGAGIRLVMYSFSSTGVFEALFEAVRRGAECKILLDGVNTFAEPARQDLLARINQAQLPIEVKIIRPERMRQLGRSYRHASSETFPGALHEKFGIFSYPGKPDEVFIGSANLSNSSDTLFAENRIIVRDDPCLTKALEHEFHVLWEQYGECASGACGEAPDVPTADCSEAQFIANSAAGSSKPVLLESVTAIMEQARRDGGSLDIAMYYFSSRRLAEALLQIAAAAPTATIRLLLDQEQLDTEADAETLGAWLDNEIKTRRLTNFQLRYHWDAKAYGWSEEHRPPGPAKVFKNSPLLLHHKFCLVNSSVLINGSFNWTDLGEQNLEDLLILKSSAPQSTGVVQRFAAEFEALWSDGTIAGDEGRAEKAVLYRRITAEHQAAEAATSESAATQSTATDSTATDSTATQSTATNSAASESTKSTANPIEKQ